MAKMKHSVHGILEVAEMSTPTPIREARYAFVRGDKGYRVDLVDEDGHTIAKLVSFRDDGKLRLYGGVPEGYGFELNTTGHLRTITKGGVSLDG